MEKTSPSKFQQEQTQVIPLKFEKEDCQGVVLVVEVM